jgi:hypothetical protein
MDEEILRRLRLLKDTKPVLFSVVRRVSLDNPWIKVKGARDLNVLISNRNYFLEKGVFIAQKIMDTPFIGSIRNYTYLLFPFYSAPITWYNQGLHYQCEA